MCDCFLNKVNWELICFAIRQKQLQQPQRWSSTPKPRASLRRRPSRPAALSSLARRSATLSSKPCRITTILKRRCNGFCWRNWFGRPRLRRRRIKRRHLLFTMMLDNINLPRLSFWPLLITCFILQSLKIKLRSQISLLICGTFDSPNGRDSACRYRQKWKGYRNFPPASVLAWGPGNKFSLKIYNFSQKWAILKVIFVLSSWNIK